MAKLKIKVPKELRGRLKDVAKKHNFASADAVVDHFIEKGLATYSPPAGDLAAQMEHITEEQGYSSVDELVEHLLLRGLDAYEVAEDDPEKLAARLRGLGYIE